MQEPELFKLFLSVTFLVLFAALAVRMGKKLKVPSVVTLIIFGVLIGYPALSEMIIGAHRGIFIFLGDLGLVVLMFLAGLESDWKLLFKEKKDAFMIALFALLAPLVLTLTVLPIMGLSFRTSFVVAVCLSISAEATRAKVLMELEKLKTRLGAALIGAGIVDDLLGLSLFLLISLIFGTGHYTENILIILSITAFFAGVGASKWMSRHEHPLRFAERSLNLLVVPFFFISIGLRFDALSLIFNPLILILIVLIAFAGKFIGVFGTKPFLDLSNRQLLLSGWGMNSRGALGLAISLVAFHNDLISVELYSSLVLTALVTTMAFPFVFHRMVRKHGSIMGEE